jgi:hypothetical protein
MSRIGTSLHSACKEDEINEAGGLDAVELGIVRRVRRSAISQRHQTVVC